MVVVGDILFSTIWPRVPPAYLTLWCITIMETDFLGCWRAGGSNIAQGSDIFAWAEVVTLMIFGLDKELAKPNVSKYALK